MPKVIKFDASALPNTHTKGNMRIGANSHDYGNSYYSMIEPPDGGYTVYENKASGGPSIRVANNEAELINLTRESSGTTYASADECLAWFATQNDKAVVSSNDVFDNHISDGLVLNLNASNLASYPRSGTTWYDLSGNNYTFTLYNGLSHDGKYLSFDGSSDYGSSDNTIDLTDTQVITVLSVFRVETGDNPMIYEHTNNWNSTNTYNKTGGGTTSYGGFGLVPNSAGGAVSNDSNHLQLRGNNGYGGVNSNISLNGRTTHNTVIHDFTDSIGGTQSIHYVNGEEVTNLGTTYGAGSNQYFGNDYIWLGKRGSGNPTSPMKLAKLMIYNRKLTESEILQNYYGGPIVTDDLVLALDAGNLVSYESSLTNWHDMVNSNYSASLVGNVSYSTTNNGTLNVDGSQTSDYIILPHQVLDNDISSNGAWSLECWLRMDDTNGTTYFFSTATPSTTNGWIIQKNSNTIFPWNESLQNGSAISFTAGETFHLTLTINGSSIYLYKNGSYIGRYSYTKNITNATGWVLNQEQDALLGGFQSSQATDMGINIIRVYNKTLSSEEVLQNFNAQRNRFGI